MDTVNKQLLKKYLNGLCTGRELQQVKALLEHPETENMLHMLMIEQADEEDRTPSAPDEDMTGKVESWKTEVQQRIAAAAQYSRLAEDKRPVRKLNFLRYAAVWTGILMVAGFTTWRLTKPGSTDQVAFIKRANGQGLPVRYLLPDSSEVFLGADSKLAYAENFKGNTREVELQGEAFFQVKHNALKPFIIHTGEIQTRVLGTSFKVQAFGGQPLVVAVATGKVGVSRHNTEQLKTLALLTPGQKITWNSKTGQAVQGTVDVASLEQWKSGNLVFDEAYVDQAMQELQRRYGALITITDKVVARHRVNGTFSADEPIGNVLKMLGVVGGFRYETNDSKSFNIYKTK